MINKYKYIKTIDDNVMNHLFNKSINTDLCKYNVPMESKCAWVRDEKHGIVSILVSGVLLSFPHKELSAPKIINLVQR